MTRLVREPLFSFLLLGAFIFAVFEYARSGNTPFADTEIVVSEARILALRADFEKKWLRTPTKVEMEALIQRFVREEVLYREALALGLDKNDNAIRQRLSQKVSFLAENNEPIVPPTDQALQSFFDANQHRYRHESRYSFRHVYFDTTNGRADSAEKQAKALLGKLRKKSDLEQVINSPLGDPTMVESEFKAKTETEIKRRLGSEFVTALNELSSTGWQGPISSSLGLHLVRLDEKITGKTAPFEEIRNQAIRDWTIQEQKRRDAEFYKQLKDKYTIIVSKQATSYLETNGTTSLVLNSMQTP